jgi:predicted transposase YbfD/YdcC
MNIIHKHLNRILPQRWCRVVEDPRRCEMRWCFSELMDNLLKGFIGGCKSFREVEMATLLAGRRIPDTTLHDLVAGLDPEPLEEEIARQVKQANRSHELDNKELPVRLTVIDGKCLSITTEPVDEYSINRSQKGCLKYVQHALRAFHASSTVKLHMGQLRMPSSTNEKGIFSTFLDRLVELYGNTNLLDVFSLDAGFTSAKNAQAIVDYGYRYIFALKDPRVHTVTRVAMELLSDQKSPDKVEEEQVNGKYITRCLYRCDVPKVKGWLHATQLWRVQKTTRSISSGKVQIEDHYYVTNIPPKKLSNSQVLKAIRLHWSIENDANWIMDTVWKEDSRPFANCALEAISLMRIMAYNIVARFKLRKLKRTKAKSWTWDMLLQAIKNILFPADQTKAFATC